jgi:hypothetical protein
LQWLSNAFPQALQWLSNAFPQALQGLPNARLITVQTMALPYGKNTPRRGGAIVSTAHIVYL